MVTVRSKRTTKQRMKLSTVKDAIESNDDEPVLAIRGTLTKLFKPMTGDGQYGPWSLQNGMLKDATGEIKVVFDNRTPVPDEYRGQVVEFRCTKGQKGGYSGVKRITDKKDGVSPKLNISDKAEVIQFNAEHQPETEPAKTPAKAPSRAQGPPEAPPRDNTAPAQSGPSNPPPRVPDEAANMAEAVGRIHEIMNAQLAVISLVHSYLVPAVKERTGITIDQQQEAALVQNCLIQMYYEKSHHFFRKGPYKFPPSTNGAPPAN